MSPLNDFNLAVHQLHDQIHQLAQTPLPTLQRMTQSFPNSSQSTDTVEINEQLAKMQASKEKLLAEAKILAAVLEKTSSPTTGDKRNVELLAKTIGDVTAFYQKPQGEQAANLIKDASIVAKQKKSIWNKIAGYLAVTAGLALNVVAFGMKFTSASPFSEPLKIMGHALMEVGLEMVGKSIVKENVMPKIKAEVEKAEYLMEKCFPTPTKQAISPSVNTQPEEEKPAYTSLQRRH